MLEITKKGKIGFITLSRPSRGNSLDPKTLIELNEALLDMNADEHIHVIVLSGQGERDFCTGIDVSAAGFLDMDGRVNIAKCAGDIANIIWKGKPVVVGINGRAMGMGLVFAAAADYVVCAQGVTLQMPEVTAGIFPGASCTPIFTRTCGLHWAKRILMLGEKFSPDQGKQAGLVDEVVPQDQVVSRAKAVARVLKRKNPTLLSTIKRALHASLEIDFNSQMALEEAYSTWFTWPPGEPKTNPISERLGFKIDQTGDFSKLE